MTLARLASRARAHLVLPPLLPLAALALPAAAPAAIQLEIVNETGRSDVYVTLHGGEYNVEGAAEDEAKLLSANPGSPLDLTVNKLISGRVYVSFGKSVTEGVTFETPTRFDWAELTVTPAAADVANLTAVDQFAIAMRMEALNGSGDTLETLGEANADTIFNALQQIPGGPQATVRNAQGEIVRILSPGPQHLLSAADRIPEIAGRGSRAARPASRASPARRPAARSRRSPSTARRSSPAL